jgi:hypothetical protein
MSRSGTTLSWQLVRRAMAWSAGRFRGRRAAPAQPLPAAPLRSGRSVALALVVVASLVLTTLAGFQLRFSLRSPNELTKTMGVAP